MAATGAPPRAAKLPQAAKQPQAPRLADDDRKRRGDPGSPGTSVISKTKPQTKRPSLYRVLLLNDDYTPMEFVVHVLERRVFLMAFARQSQRLVEGFFETAGE